MRHAARRVVRLEVGADQRELPLAWGRQERRGERHDTRGRATAVTLPSLHYLLESLAVRLSESARLQPCLQGQDTLERWRGLERLPSDSLLFCVPPPQALARAARRWEVAAAPQLVVDRVGAHLQGDRQRKLVLLQNTPLASTT